jgi:hypothetical protein
MNPLDEFLLNSLSRSLGGFRGRIARLVSADDKILTTLSDSMLQLQHAARGFARQDLYLFGRLLVARMHSLRIPLCKSCSE